MGTEAGAFSSLSASALCVLARLSWVLRTLEAGFSPFEGIPASARVAAENLVVLRSLRGCRIRTRNSILDLGFGVPSTTVVVFLGCGELKASTRRQGQVTPDRLPTCTWSKREGSPEVPVLPLNGLGLFEKVTLGFTSQACARTEWAGGLN